MVTSGGLWKASDEVGLGWLAFSLLLTLSYLLPSHQQPWLTFYQQWLAAVAMAVGLLGLCVRSKGFALDRGALLLLCVAAIPTLQAALGQLTLPGEGGFISFYLLGAASVYVMARQSQTVDRWKLADALFTGLTVAALASSGFALVQWLGLDIGGVLILSAAVGGRSMANVGQPNMLATLLAWGLLGLWWAEIRGAIRARYAFAAGVVILLGMAATQSRTAWLEVAGLAIGAVYLTRRFGRPSSAWLMLGLGAVCMVLALAWPHLSQLVFHPDPLELSYLASAGKRPQIWSMMISAVMQRPWAGYGWNQGIQAFMGQLDAYPTMHIVYGDAHNLVLDLMVWNGAPVGLSIALALLGYWAWLLRQSRLPEEVLLALGIGVFLIHAMTELPYAYANFLLPTALMFGCLAAQHTTSVLFVLPRRYMAALGALMLLGLLQLGYDYWRIEQDQMAYRIRTARIGDLTPVASPKPVLLSYLQDALNSFRITPERGMKAEELAVLKASVTRYPSVPGLLTWAQAAALNDHPVEAKLALRRLCQTTAPKTCDIVKQVWSEKAANASELQRVNLPAN